MSVETSILLLRFIYSKKQSKEKEKRKEKWEKLKRQTIVMESQD